MSLSALIGAVHSLSLSTATNPSDDALITVSKVLPQKKRSNIPSLSSSSGVANSDEQKANILALTLKENFAENKRPGDESHPIDKEITNTLENLFSTPPSLPLPLTDPVEICEYIRRLKNNKAPGSDLITNKMVKNFNTKTLLILTYLINMILFLGHFPNNWKNAIVFPIKKPDKNAHNPSSYRPISLLSILSKITEYVILNRLKTFTNETNFSNPNQYGFTRNLSAYHPLLGLTEKITAGFQRGRSTGAVFLDIQKAFDRVWIKKTHLKQHLTHKRDKFRKALRALYPLIGWNSQLNMYNKILLYTAVLRPILTYGSPVWGYAADANIKILEVAQNSIIRNIVKADRYTNNSLIYNDIKSSPT
ncbi:probable RNA-directed DNA polymerase from transposon X-element [Trichonephila clavipes]|nr:probable RNA-directed DNA polymerase from transposon X-element [Trichonephila clavipes]